MYCFVIDFYVHMRCQIRRFWDWGEISSVLKEFVECKNVAVCVWVFFNIRYWLSIDFTLDFISIRSLNSCADIFIPEPSSDCRSQQLNRMSRSFTVASSDRRLTRETQLNVHPLNYVISKNIAPKNPQWECNIWMKTTATLRQHQRKNNWNHISIVEYHEKVAQIMLSLSYFEFRFGVYFFSL